MLPAETVIRAAARWLSLLRFSNVAQASSIIRADPAYTDLTLTHYGSALEWIRALDFLDKGSDGLELEHSLRALPDPQVHQLFFERLLARETPPWLTDSDLLVTDAGEIPQDAAAVAETLGLGDEV